MEGRITHRQRVIVSGAKNSLKNRARLLLLHDFDQLGKACVRLHDQTRGLDRHRVNFGRNEFPSIALAANNRVNTIGPRTNIKDTNPLSSRHLPLIRLGQQVRQMMNIIGSPGDRRTQIAQGDHPVLHLIDLRQQRLIQTQHCRSVTEVDRLVARGIGAQEVLQLRARITQ